MRRVTTNPPQSAYRLLRPGVVRARGVTVGQRRELAVALILTHSRLRPRCPHRKEPGERRRPAQIRQDGRRIDVGRSSEPRLEELWVASIASRQGTANEFELLFQVLVGRRHRAHAPTHPGGERPQVRAARRSGVVFHFTSVRQSSEPDLRLAPAVIAPWRWWNVLGALHRFLSSVAGISPRSPTNGSRWERGSTADRGARVPTTPAKNKRLSTSFPKAKRNPAVRHRRRPVGEPGGGLQHGHP